MIAHASGSPKLNLTVYLFLAFHRSQPTSETLRIQNRAIVVYECVWRIRRPLIPWETVRVLRSPNYGHGRRD